jgi:hypothetical protein
VLVELGCSTRETPAAVVPALYVYRFAALVQVILVAAACVVQIPMC